MHNERTNQERDKRSGSLSRGHAEPQSIEQRQKPHALGKARCKQGLGASGRRGARPLSRIFLTAPVPSTFPIPLTCILHSAGAVIALLRHSAKDEGTQGRWPLR